jgi:hypothetical protein
MCVCGCVCVWCRILNPGLCMCSPHALLLSSTSSSMFYVWTKFLLNINIFQLITESNTWIWTRRAHYGVHWDRKWNLSSCPSDVVYQAPSLRHWKDLPSSYNWPLCVLCIVLKKMWPGKTASCISEWPVLARQVLYHLRHAPALWVAWCNEFAFTLLGDLVIHLIHVT